MVSLPAYVKVATEAAENNCIKASYNTHDSVKRKFVAGKWFGEIVCNHDLETVSGFIVNEKENVYCLLSASGLQCLPICSKALNFKPI